MILMRVVKPLFLKTMHSTRPVNLQSFCIILGCLIQDLYFSIPRGVAGGGGGGGVS